MQELLEQVSQAIGVTTEKAIELYPVLRQEYVWYRIFERVEAIVAVIVGILTVTTILSNVFLFGAKTDGDEQTAKLLSKVIKLAFIALILSILVFVGVGVFKATLAPDILIIKDILGK